MDKIKTWLKDAGKGTVGLLAVILMIIVLVLIERFTKMDWKLFAVIGGIAFGFRFLAVWEKVWEKRLDNAKMEIERLQRYYETKEKESE